MIEGSHGPGWEVINLTPHDVVIVDAVVGGMRYPCNGQIARIEERYIEVDRSTLTVPLCHVVQGEVEGLPPSKRNIWYIVSRMIFDALPNRHDLLVPVDVVRNDAGQIEGARKFLSRAAKRSAGIIDDWGEQRYPDMPAPQRQ